MSNSQLDAGRGVRGIGRILMILGILVFAAGVATYIAVGAQLKAEKIPINGDTPFMNSVFGSGEGETPKEVGGPLGAIAQAEGIKMHTENMPGNYGFEDLNGRTAGEIAHIRSAKEYAGAGGEEADAKMTALWNMMNTSSFLRSSLMLSAMAFGVALLVAGVGVVVLLVGWGLLKAGRGLGDQRPNIGQVTEVVTSPAAPVLMEPAEPPVARA
ncbi:MAG: hypothetical protein LBC97_09115 [Bifidobacteriaceae bacterium]|jgi:hypothetical protein|nr:hypothetical protein [Bifidobacteriaceae bacterium]